MEPKGEEIRHRQRVNDESAEERERLRSDEFHDPLEDNGSWMREVPADIVKPGDDHQITWDGEDPGEVSDQQQP